jgi:anthranilate phosphoribosyltransferase
VNTRLVYLYRDASNYKATMSAVLAGELSAEEIALLRGAIALTAVGAGIDPVAFSPVDLGLPPAQDALWAYHARNEDDHIYNELLDIEPTAAAVTWTTVSAAGLLAAAECAVREGYDVARAMDVLGIEA